MALGGYKFVGYHYSVPSGYDSSDTAQVKAQCLRMFKCRLKAFIDSCALSGAQWEFSYSNGQNSFGSYGNVIYTLDSDGYNFGCFFKYSGREQYYCLASFQYLTSNFNSNYGYYASSSNYFSDSNRHKSSIGKSLISPTNWSSIQTGNLRFRGAFNPTNVFSAITPTVSNMFFGFATKGCDVIEFYKSSLNPNFHASSANGFTTLCSPSDTCPAMDIVEWGGVTGSNVTQNYAIRKYVGVTRGDGSAYVGPTSTSNVGAMCIYENPAACFKDPVDVIPYASALVTNEFTVSPTANSSFVNNDGIRSKGFTNVEFIATNTPYEPSTLNIYKPYNNGNHLCFAWSYNSSYAWNRCALYCGWDPSNPDITQSSAWTEYSD